MANHWEVISNNSRIVSNTPQDLWKSAISYFMWCDENPIISKKLMTSGKSAEEEVIRPYTIRGLCLHCGITEEYIKDLRRTKDFFSDYFIVISKILYIIYVQNQEMATVGLFNAVFVSRVLGMDKESDDIQRGVKVIIESGLPKLSNSENEILEKIESEYNQIIKLK